MRRRFEIGGRVVDAALLRTTDGYALALDGRTYAIRQSEPDANGMRTLLVGDRSWPVHLVRDGDDTFVHIAGRSHAVRTVEPLTLHAHAGAARSDLVARAPMPGTVVSVQARPGARVHKGETLMVIESMKLETAITAWRDGTIEVVHLAAGQTFDRDAPLVSLAPEADR